MVQMDASKMEELMGFQPGELEQTAEAYDSDRWPAGTSVRIGRPPLCDEPTTVISGRVPQSVAEAFENKARQHGQTRAERLRELIAQDARTAP